MPSNISIKLQHDLGLRSLHHLCFCKKDSSQKACRKTVHSCSERLGSSRVGLYLVRENLPKRMLTKFSRLVETLKRRIPAIDRGILFRDPTRLRIVNQTRSALSLTWWTPPFLNTYKRMCFHTCCLNQTLKENDSSKYRLHPTDSTHHYQPWGVIWYDPKLKLCLYQEISKGGAHLPVIYIVPHMGAMEGREWKETSIEQSGWWFLSFFSPFFFSIEYGLLVFFF